MIKIEEIRALVEQIDRRFVAAVPIGHDGEIIMRNETHIFRAEWETIRAAIFYGVECEDLIAEIDAALLQLQGDKS